ncbi:hypothetical protein [Plantactinospora sp. B5E13]|uniref:hypothetical protein n=1 Tax=Plantactinospora sp. B5E13 TaxID=3153758 RepID=UPI00325F8B08
MADERPPVIKPEVVIPDLPEGSLLRLAPADWSHGATLPVGACVQLTLSRIHRNVTRHDESGCWVWVVGHEHPACTWPHVEPHPPCLQLPVRVGALDASASRP